jgi:phosphotransacetylase
VKHKGNHYEYSDERDRDLLKVFNEKFTSSEMNTYVIDIMKEVVCSPSSRFWVSEDRAAIVISNMMRDRSCLDGMIESKKRMYEEILKRTLDVIDNNPGIALINAVRMVVAEKAPEFYITPESAIIIIHRIKKRCYEERKRKLRHLFL